MGNKKHWAVVAAALVLLVIFLAIGFGVSASSGKIIDTKYYKDSGTRKKLAFNATQPCSLHHQMALSIQYTMANKDRSEASLAKA